MSYTYDLKIPKERIAVLIGTKGETKKKLEELTDSTLEIDSQEGDILISGEDSLGVYTAREVIRAIGRGFNPEVALLILKPEYSCEVLNIQEYAGKGDIARIKARVIGSEGKTRKFVEEATETFVTVYGKTISIIGEIERVTLARQAIERLLEGAMHASVYRWLDKKRKELKFKEVM